MQDSLHLLKTRRFLPLFATQFLGAFNDNLFRTAMVMLVIYGIYRDAEQEAEGFSSFRFSCCRHSPANLPMRTTRRESFASSKPPRS